MEKDIAGSGVELAEARTHANASRTASEALKAEVAARTKELKSIEAKISEETKMLTAFKDELDELDRAIKAKRQEIADGDLRIKELEHEVDRLKRDQKSGSDAILKLEKQFEWIQDECQCVPRVPLTGSILTTSVAGPLVTLDLSTILRACRWAISRRSASSSRTTNRELARKSTPRSSL